jgi:hypothetical protein
LQDLQCAFNGKQTPLLRPEMGHYNDRDRLGWSAYQGLWLCHRAYGNNFEALPEFEAWPFTGFNHSTRVMEMKHSWAAAHRFGNAADSIFWDESRTLYEPSLAKKYRSALDGAASIHAVVSDTTLQPRGVTLELEDGVAASSGGSPVRGWGMDAVTNVASLGIPLWPLDPIRADHGVVIAGNAVLRYRDQLPQLSRCGLILDKSAFDILLHHGESTLTRGVKITTTSASPIIERFGNSGDNGRAAGAILSLACVASLQREKKFLSLPSDDGIEILSWFETQNGNRVAPAAWRRETVEGRIGVLPFDLNVGPRDYVANWLRKSQLEGMLEWVSRRSLPVKIFGAADLFSIYYQSENDDRAVMALANFSLDSAAQVTLNVPLAAQWQQWRLRLLKGANEWINVCDGAGAEVLLAEATVIQPQSVAVIELSLL